MSNNKNYIEAFTKMVVVLVLSYHVKSPSKCTKYIYWGSLIFDN